MTGAVSIGLLWLLWVGTGEGWRVLPTPQYPALLHRAIVKGLANDMTGSLMISHDTLRTAMGALLAGSDGSTADEVLEGMIVPSLDGRHEIPDIISNTSPDSYRFEKKSFVGVYLPPERKPRDDFENAMRDMGVDLIYSNPNNSWPRPTLKDILLHERLDRIPAMVRQPEVFVVTAATFRAAWEDDDFSLLNYRIREFNVNNRRRTYLDTMYSLAKQRQVAVLPQLSAKMLLLPLKESRVVFMVILPDMVEGLQKLEEELQYRDLRKLLRSQLDSRKYDVILPKMNILTNVELAGKLGSLNIRQIFDPEQADLSRISRSSPHLYVRRFQHVTKISINGKGINLHVDYVDPKSNPTRNDPGPAEHFYATHPFFFALLDEEQIYTTGRYGDFPADPEDLS